MTAYNAEIYFSGYKYTISYEEGMVVFRYFEESDDFKKEKMRFSVADADLEELMEAAKVVADNSEYF